MKDTTKSIDTTKCTHIDEGRKHLRIGEEPIENIDIEEYKKRLIQLRKLNRKELMTFESCMQDIDDYFDKSED